MNQKDLTEAINTSLNLTLPHHLDYDALQTALANQINKLILQDFNLLISLLYRIDISESKLKSMLKNRPQEQAGKIIAGLIIDRQLQKIESRKQFGYNTGDPDAEKW